MNIVETIQQKVIQLPLQAQNEVLEIVEMIEERYFAEEANLHPLNKISQIHIDGPIDLAERHDFYSNGKLED
jgi:hypothetical protein